MAFYPDKVDQFRLTGFDADAASGVAQLRYALDDEYHFEESVDFGRAAALGPGMQAGFEAVVRLLHLVAGVSYYKTAAPRRNTVETGGMSPAEARLVHDIYDRGMREFAFCNGLELPRSLSIEALSPASPGRPVAGDGAGVAREAPPAGLAVPIGGGKDSIVVLEALRDLAPVVVSVNPNPASRRVASTAGIELAAIERTLDPLLFELNRQGALNGHVPVTAIVSLVAVAAGYLYGYDTTVMALERSADAPTRVIRTLGGAAVEVNHQWSKSEEFERELQGVLMESVHPSIRYLSPLRGFTELEITAAFATLTPYLSAFRSCNATARLSGASDEWCGDCPKCRFVFLALAVPLGREGVVAVFGKDLLAEPSQLEGFSDLLDPNSKPFDCVGTVEEVTDAMRMLLADPAWSGAGVLEALRQDLETLPAHAAGEVMPRSRVLEAVRSAVTGPGPG